jgi:integrase
MSAFQLLDAAGRRRSPATVPGFHAGRPPRNKGVPLSARSPEGGGDHRRYAPGGRVRPRATSSRTDRRALAGRTPGRRGDGADRARSRPRPRLAARPPGQGGKRRDVGMDSWGFEQLRPWLARRVEMPVGTLFCVIDGQTRGRPWTPAAARNQLCRIAAKAGARRRFAPHQLRHAHAVEMARERVPLNVIQRQLGHVNLGVTSVYLDGIDTAEIIDTVHNRRPPMISASAGLRI